LLVKAYQREGSKGSAGGSTPSATATSLLTATPGLLFYDDFSGPNKGWVITRGASYSRYIEQHRLIMTASNHKIVPQSVPVDDTFDNVKVSITFLFQQVRADDGAGFYLRGDSNLDHDYRFEIFGNGTYAIAREYLDIDRQPQSFFLVGPEHTRAIKPVGKSNTLTVLAQGPELTVWINGTLVKKVQDPSYTKGQVALYVQNGEDSPSVRVAFQNVAIYDMPLLTPAPLIHSRGALHRYR
jgi:hypothetical protein